MAKKKSKSKKASTKKLAKKTAGKSAKKSASTVGDVDSATADSVSETPSVYETADFVPEQTVAGDVTRSLNPFEATAEKVRTFPQSPGVYLMKDSAGVVIYVGKATNLRSRAGSYFLKAASEESRTADWVRLIADADFIECDSEVDALLVESRLIKDIQPQHNKILKDDKTFPYLQITTHEDFPRIEVTREPMTSGVKLYGPFASAGSLRGAVQVLQRIFKFRTCSLDIDENDQRWKWYRPCLLASIKQCTAPCNLRISKEDYRKDIRRLQQVLMGNKKKLLGEMKSEMLEASKELQFEKAARLRDEIEMLESLDRRGELDTHVQPEVFHIDPKKGLTGLRQVLKLSETPRSIEGVDIAHLGGNETVASLVQFIDGLPFKPGYRRFKIKGVDGVDDFRSIHEVVARRFKRLSDENDVFPDILLIDGGKGQLSSAVAAFEALEIEPPILLSLAKKNEEIYRPGESEPIRLSRHAFSLRLLQYVRDEAHRFAQHYHHILRSKAQFD
ncbi:excinuclease ABC subunit UvrC [Mariniblastus fucicola]|uniref:UvrABC system protein C n=1 Tax=Mariniblastus fucicola TaxID=980251 RepID=A0A5B9P954_9BACT|nr:excinuclease ABC subunit UvrC [Mariniblastus fucicola]QEG23277.1 UvrABC system protein C [Mariniblastus fucicola]